MLELTPSGPHAADLDVAVEQVNVKATTTECLGFTGRGEGIAAEAVCLIAAGPADLGSPVIAA